MQGAVYDQISYVSGTGVQNGKCFIAFPLDCILRCSFAVQFSSKTAMRSKMQDELQMAVVQYLTVD